MADKPMTSFAHERRLDLPEHQSAVEEAAALSRAAFEQARTIVSVADDRTRVTAQAANELPEPRHVLPDPRPSFAGSSPTRPSDTITPDRSMTVAPEEMKVAFVKARLGRSTRKVIKDRDQ